MVKVSVVIPVYNVENYLRDCLDSIVNQTLEDIEIICIDDGSPDNSIDILNEYAAKDPRMTVVRQENGGHAVATNRGMDMATGKYLFLMDSDDILELNALEDSYKKAEEKDVDFVLFKAINYDHPNDRYYETEVYSMDKIAKRVGENVFSHEDIGDLMFQASVTPWSKLYNRKFIMDNNIRFPEGLIFEDNVFFYKALFSAKRIYFLKEFLFIRRWYATSSTTAGDLRFLNSIDVINLMIKVFKEFNQYERYKKHLLNRKVSLGIMRYNKIKEQFKETYYQALRDDFLLILKDPVYYNDLISNVNYSNKKIFQQVIISETHEEFDLLRKAYAQDMDNEGKKKILFRDLLTSEFTNFSKTPEEYKPAYFNQIKAMFTQLIDDPNLYNQIFRYLNYKNKKVFERVMIADNYEEYKLIKKAYNETQRVHHFKDLIERKTREHKHAKKEADELLNSNSWKITEPLRR